MATVIPFTPGLAIDPVAEHARYEGLRRATWDRIHGHGRRVRPSRLLQGQPQVERYLPDEHDWDGLCNWYYQVRDGGEHTLLWGQAGLSPAQFLRTFGLVPLYVVHEGHASWIRGTGWLLAFWLDDVHPHLRTRLHVWVHPSARTPQVSVQLGHLMLRHLFHRENFALVEARWIPDQHNVGRFARRLGFQVVTTLPVGLSRTTLAGETVLMPMVHAVLTRERWDALTTSRSIPNDAEAASSLEAGPWEPESVEE